MRTNCMNKYNANRTNNANRMKKVMRVVSLVVMSLLVVLSLSACGKQEDALHKVKKNKVLTVGLLPANPPYEFETNKGNKSTLRGSDIELVKKIAESMHVKYQIKTLNMDGLLPALQTGKVDMLVTTLAPNPEREKAATFSNTYFKADNGIVVRKQDFNKYNNNLNALNNSTFGLINGSTMQPIISKKFPKAQQKLFQSPSDLALSVNNNKTDSFSLDVPESGLILRSNPNLRLLDYRYKDDTTGASVAMPKNRANSLKEQVNKVIDQYKDEYPKWVNDQIKYVPKQ